MPNFSFERANSLRIYSSPDKNWTQLYVDAANYRYSNCQNKIMFYEIKNLPINPTFSGLFLIISSQLA